MKKWMTVALMGLIASILFLAVAQAQTTSAAPSDKGTASKGTASLESTLGCFEAFMNGVLAKIQANMDKIDTFNGKVKDLRDIVQAVSIEIKDAEGKIVGLRQDIDAMGNVQKKYGSKIAALEKQLSDLAAACDAVTKKADVNQNDLANLKQAFSALSSDYQSFKESVQAEISALKKNVADLDSRVKVLEDQDVGTFKKKVIELERTMSALSIKIDNNRAKLEGFDQALAGLQSDIAANKSAILANKKLLQDHEKRIAALENGAGLADLQDQVNTLYFLSIVGLLAGVGALVWGFLGSSQ